MGKPILCLDFDGVCHSYISGWKGASVIPDPPVPGLFEFLLAAQEHFDVQIFSSRSRQEGGIAAMQDWMFKHFAKWQVTFDASGVCGLMISFPTEKPPAFVGLDDRVLTFKGVWPDVRELRDFKTWNAKGV